MVKNKFKFPKTLLAIILLTAYCVPLTATVRYVSHEGSNTPPYLTWETAADSIMSAINISVFGDTIYVANGVYKEQVIMIPGLTLVGAGADSTIIDTRDFAAPWPWYAITVADSCVLQGFKVIVANSTDFAWGIGDAGSSGSRIILNRITSSGAGIGVNNLDTSNISNIYIYKNIIDNVTIGIDLFNSNAVVRSNIIYTDPNSQSSVVAGINIGAYFFNYKPVIDSNYIETGRKGIYKSFGASPIITNNKIVLKGPGAIGIFLGDADSGKVYNNLIIAKSGVVVSDGIHNYATQYLRLYNNYLTGQYYYQVINMGPYNKVKNNVVTDAGGEIRAWGNENLLYQYNNVWNSDINYSGFTPDITNLSVDPMIVNEDSLNFHLQMFSPLIDAGDPNIFDVDGSRSDIGLYGGPFGEKYKYLDLAPKPPRNLTAVVDSQYINLSWNSNTEADFNSYNLFRDTTANFIADSTTFVASLTDTFYIQIIPGGIDAFYYKLTATDNQGNESQPSEELAVIITSINEYPAAVSNYQLYQNYPNPFNPSTKIAYKLKERGYVKLYVYDIKGELVDVLVNQVQEAGYYEVEFFGEVGNRQSAVGNQLSSGIYIYQIIVKNGNSIPVFTDMKKMLLLK